VRHASIDDKRSSFLKRAALRICISEEVAAAISSTGLVNGPIIVIPIGIDLSVFPKKSIERDIPVLIDGIKNPLMAKRLKSNLNKKNIVSCCIVEKKDRNDYLSLMGRAFITVYLPRDVEGFYMPAIEGMAMGTNVVCPDCIGNRAFCIDGVNCLQPEYTEESITAAVSSIVQSATNKIEIMKRKALETVSKFAIEREKDSFHQILNDISIL
jgi:glycosyltransferase involved in cell wall biosynthesis